MLPVTDIIPTRTVPGVTLTLIAASTAFWVFMLRGNLSIIAFHALYLWLFGRTVEDRLGHVRFAVLFVACAAVAWTASSAYDAVAGGITGVIGAYFLMYPQSAILVLVPLPVLLVEIPALIFAGLWLLLEVITAPVWPQTASLVAGAVLCLAMKRPERARVEWWSP